VLDRYVDPLAASAGRGEFDRMIREHANRMHLVGPAMHSFDPGACRSGCVRIFHEARGVAPVRVRTEIIRAR
jgi:hypothetical protein